MHNKCFNLWINSLTEKQTLLTQTRYRSIFIEVIQRLNTTQWRRLLVRSSVNAKHRVLTHHLTTALPRIICQQTVHTVCTRLYKC